MIYLKQVKLLDPDLVAGDPEELKYPYKAPAVRFTESFIFRKPVTFLGKQPEHDGALSGRTGRENPPCWKR